MASKGNLWIVPVLNEYFFNLMATANDHQKSILNFNELRHFRSPEAIRRFVDNESLDRKMLLIARLGFSFTFTIHDDGFDVPALFDKVKDQAREAGARVQLIENQVKEKVFVLSSRDLLLSSHMAAQNSQSQVYTLNMQYKALHYDFKTMKADSTASGVTDAIDGFDKQSKVVLEAISVLDEIETLAGVSEYELKILLALYPYRHTFTDIDKVAKLIHVVDRNKGVAKVAGFLEAKGYIARQPGFAKKNKQRKFMIMEKGINAVAKYLHYVHNKSLYG